VTPLALALTGAAVPALACSGPAAVCSQPRPGAMALIGDGPVAVLTDVQDDAGVRDAAADLATDVARVGGRTVRQDARTAVIVGTIGRNPIIDALIAAGRLDVRAVRGRWEGFLQQVVERPAPGIDRALVIAGADRRGAIFGAYDLSRRIGVSPWHWWADVPVRRQARLYVLPGARADWPRVRYRGIFLNDEEPALGGWARATFGGVNARFYDKVFELTLRLKGNLLWPAMWSKSLWDDDPASAALAQRRGIVLGTSHHEPMERAHVEWQRHGSGPWDYTKNAATLQSFWRAGLTRRAGRETLVTIGMRGDGDEAMTEGTAIPLLQRIVADQRRIIAEVTGRPAAETPQVWALYKEVQDYFDAGMRVPDDVTLLFSDDNWGNIRRLPRPGERRAGGYGVYYHFDYVGGPRNYKWLNTNQIARVWEQMQLARAHGADRLWIVNVGDLKPMELPTSFFLDLAWNPEAMPVAAMADYHRRWAAEQFGAAGAAAIGDVLDRTTRYLARQKPEFWSPDSWSLDDGEADRVLTEWAALARDAAAARPTGAVDAYFQLVEHPVLAAANLARLYVTVARNRRAAAEGRVEANALADAAARLFADDAAIRRRYEASAGGKWPMMMAQTHIGYTGWQQPERDVMPAVQRVAPGTPVRSIAHGLPRPELVVDATRFTRSTGVSGARWLVVPGLGRNGGAVTPWPQVAPAQAAGRGPALTYAVTLPSAGAWRVTVAASPSLDVTNSGRRYAIAIDGGRPQVVDLWRGTGQREWADAVTRSVRETVTVHRVAAPGRHTVRLWMVDPGVVVQQLRFSPAPRR
jgi:hypothetical protein